MTDVIKPEGTSPLGRPTGHLGPVTGRVGIPIARRPVEIGNITTVAGSTIITGSGGTDFTRIEQRARLKINTLNGPENGLVKVKNIISATQIELFEPVGVTLANQSYKIADQYNLGLAIDSSMKESRGYADFIAMQTGKAAYKKILNSYFVTVEVQLLEPVLELLQKLDPGFKINVDALTGMIKGAAQTASLWEDILQGNGLELSLTALTAPKTPSIDPMDTITFPATRIYPAGEWMFQGDNPIALKVAFEAQLDERTMFKGRPVAYYLGDLGA
ncbi:hypothetical protein [Leptospira interrogans]|uniref:hypothetical protein n=1 Tax=Leptospira interrogans TaxID=173 RepID=UPI00030EEE8B|nr:hypothetical protein [Leptospira interrogans]ULG86689.1 hypothetical protein FH594_21840 [Leptospira interrogans]ULG86708.1 hypothetical protein FH594_21950 [Leptospira interrogans]ULG86731.1 hypothetical protein FH594_21415 [Leptospira interrogans]